MTRTTLATGLIVAAAVPAGAQELDGPRSAPVARVAPTHAAHPAMELERLEPLLEDGAFDRVRRAADLALTLAILAEEDRAERLRRLEEAEAHARAALAVRPDDAEARFLLGAAIGIGIRYRSGRAKMRAAEEVRRLADAILAVDPDHPGGLHLDGQLHAAAMRLGGIERFVARTIFGGDALAGASWEAAESAFRRALEAEPGNLAHRWELARVLRDTGQVDAARRELQRIVEATDPSPLADVYRRRAWAELAEIR